MKKMVSFAVAALCVLLFMHCAYAEAFVFPGDLTRIEAEAFANCGYIRGLVKLPATVVYVGPRAFDGTDVFALEIGDGAAEISADAFDELGYIYLHGRESRLPAELIGKAKNL
ncbi:MAG: leucine-rich repeat protein, partial [Clostridia bacterium]|nr:leucine-rich repeat protein [Clostridia bacterium]